MSNYVQTNFFTPLDSLPVGNPAKIIIGTSFDTEFGNIATAVASKANTVGLFNGPITIPAATTGATLVVNNVGATAALFTVYGDGGVTIGTASVTDEGAGTLNIATALYINSFPLYVGKPVNTVGSTYTTVLADMNKTIVSTASGSTMTIPTNAVVAYPIGTELTFVYYAPSGAMVINSGDTFRLAGTTSTGARNVAVYGVATALKVASTVWMIYGTGVS
jgi:hypothetical protein